MEALVVSRLDVREYDQHITLLTKESGLLRARARGVKKGVSKNSAALEPFAHIDVAILPGKEQAYIGSVQVLEYFSSLRDMLSNCIAAEHLVRTAACFLRIDQHDPRVFALAKDSLVHLARQSAEPVAILNNLIVQLCACMGYMPVFDCCVDCGGQEYLEFFSIAQGGVICRSCKEPHQSYMSLSAEKHALNALLSEYATYHTEQSVPKYHAWQKSLALA